jgi:hypothetical protein
MAQSKRLTFSATVEIKAEPAEVFAVVSDLRRKALLNPNIQVIRVELEGEEPVREGSIFYHRFQRGTRILEYRSQCVRLVFPRLFETRSETDPPFKVRVTLEPTSAGCKLTQEETAEVTAGLLDAFEPTPTKLPSFRDIITLFALFPSTRPIESEFRALQHERVTQKLTGELQCWLDTIRAHLEAKTFQTS